VVWAECPPVWEIINFLYNFLFFIRIKKISSRKHLFILLRRAPQKNAVSVLRIGLVKKAPAQGVMHGI
jgi:hypothetical protein